MTTHTSSEEQTFLDELDKKLWNSADRLRSNLDAAVYKHAVLGLIFLKYVSDSFALRREELQAMFADPKSDYFLDRAGYESDAAYAAAIHDELEDRDYFTEKNVFWVPPLARWQTIKENASLAPDTVVTIHNGKTETYTFRSVARLIDDALEAVEKENPRLKGVIEKNRYMQLQLESSKLIGLISEVISSIPFRHASLSSKDILGHVYEYFLGQFALAEGKKGGQYYTPKSIVSVIVEMLEPYQGKVYDPAMGSGGFFVQSEAFIEKYGGKIGQISVYGQESNPTTWRLAAMNMAIRGIDFNFGKQPADTFLSDQHPDLRADYVMANPPFNISEWWDGRLEGDPRWVYGTPPKSNANFAWVQHMLHHLSPTGSAGIVLADMALNSNDSSEFQVRQALIDADLVECIVSLPDKLFTSTPIGASIWILSKSKKSSKHRDRRGEMLFIDARTRFVVATRTLNILPKESVTIIAETFKAWRRGDGYVNQPGFCATSTNAAVRENGYSLFPPAYVEPAHNKQFAMTSDSGDLTRLAESLKLTADSIKELHREPILEVRLVEYRLADILDRSNVRLGSVSEPEILTCTESAGLILQRERFSKRVATEDSSEYKIVQRGDIVYNPYLLWAGSIDQCWIVDIGITSPAYEVFRIKDGFDLSLIGAALKSKEMLARYDGISVGTVKRRRRAPPERFLELKVTIPEKSCHSALSLVNDAFQKAIFAHQFAARKYSEHLKSRCAQLLSR